MNRFFYLLVCCLWLNQNGFRTRDRHKLPDANGGERVYKLRLAIEHGEWSARVVLDPDGVPRDLRVADTSRPVVRSWRRQR